jgi:hypothetical protein
LVYLKLVFSDSVKSKVFVVDGIESATKDAGLDLVVFVGQQLEFDVRIAGTDVGITSRQTLASDHGDVERTLFNIVPYYAKRNRL